VAELVLPDAVPVVSSPPSSPVVPLADNKTAGGKRVLARRDVAFPVPALMLAPRQTASRPRCRLHSRPGSAFLVVENGPALKIVQSAVVPHVELRLYGETARRHQTARLRRWRPIQSSYHRFHLNQPFLVIAWQTCSAIITRLNEENGAELYGTGPAGPVVAARAALTSA